jgi:Holliday junction DNA helicase RuvA
MIAMLSGTLKLRDPGRLIVTTGGVGYEVFVPLSTYYRMPSVDAEVDLEIRQVVRKDAVLLYGFASWAEKQAFDLLMGIQHVGPTLALSILSVVAPKDLVAAISHEDVERIDAVPGEAPRSPRGSYVNCATRLVSPTWPHPQQSGVRRPTVMSREAL